MVHLLIALRGVFSSLTPLTPSTPPPPQITPGAFWLVVAVTFNQEADVATFEKAFKPLAEYVTKAETSTLSYGFAKSDSDPKRILIFERYATKQAYLDVHKTSEAFLAFRPQLSALNAKIDGHSYYEGGLGFI